MHRRGELLRREYFFLVSAMVWCFLAVSLVFCSAGLAVVSFVIVVHVISF